MKVKLMIQSGFKNVNPYMEAKNHSIISHYFQYHLLNNHVF
jgi:hypothetical protein